LIDRLVLNFAVSQSETSITKAPRVLRDSEALFTLSVSPIKQVSSVSPSLNYYSLNSSAQYFISVTSYDNVSVVYLSIQLFTKWHT